MRSPSAKDVWKKTWDIPAKRQQILSGTVIMFSVVFMMPHFFNYIEKRRGTIINDWVLAQIPPHNVSVLIFAVIWSMILFIMIRAIHNPSIYINYCWTYIFVSVTRLICIYLVPLDPPRGLISLTDPLTGIFYGNAVIDKDLFFSGHTATLTLIVYCLQRTGDKIIALIATVIVACLLLVQHIHYTIDVVTAPVVVFGYYRFTQFLLYKKKQPQKVISKAIDMLKAI